MRIKNPWEPGYRILMAGSRGWPSAILAAKFFPNRPRDRLGVLGDQLVTRILCDRVVGLPEERTPVTLVHGACSAGLDLLVAEHQFDLGRQVLTEGHPANWSLGRRAGPLRNEAMAAMGADVAEVFLWSLSRGTVDAMCWAFACGIETWATALWPDGTVSRCRVMEETLQQIKAVHANGRPDRMRARSTIEGGPGTVIKVRGL